MKKILWLSNYRFSNKRNCGSGTWVEAMGKGLVSLYDDISLFNVTIGGVDAVAFENFQGIDQIVLPIKYFKRRNIDVMPPLWLVQKVLEYINNIKPDLIHIWGTERFWGSLTANNRFPCPTLLEMQGITSAMAPYMTGCLTQDEIKRCRGFKEWLCPMLKMERMQKAYHSTLSHECTVCKGHKYIDYQSEWVKAYLDEMNCNAQTYKTRMILRNEFYNTAPWEYKGGCHSVFTSCGWSANKGLHVLVRACGMIKKFYPDIEVVVAGDIQSGLRRSGYTKFVLSEASRLGIRLNVLGSLNACELIDQMKLSAMYVNPSFVESYSISLAEAMAVGCPCVVSYSGAMPEVGGESCLYFPIADVGLCATRIREVFELGIEAEAIGREVRKRSLRMHDYTKGVTRQMDIYNRILRD